MLIKYVVKTKCWPKETGDHKKCEVEWDVTPRSWSIIQIMR